ncbi:MAG: hypothetical protein U9R53_00995 [Chloroflexota bacterium]|nr:hypothetical protein [Chloroflexota bacterium]
MMLEVLQARELNGGKVIAGENQDWQLEIPKLPEGRYALGQIDDYVYLPRYKFPHQAPVSLQLDARVSGEDYPGTWGFGFWNDPFNFGFGAGGMPRVLPVLPNAAWFFYGSDKNYLSLREDQPAAGFHVKVFSSPLIPSFLSILAIPILPLFFWPAAVRFIRRTTKLFVKEEACSLSVRVTEWHTYRLVWHADRVKFEIDQKVVFTNRLSPKGRLGLVIWIDNQYFRFGPDGKFGFGFTETPTTQAMTFRNIKLSSD